MAPASADEIICDPACGTSGFLVAAGEYLKANRKEEIFFNRQNKDHYMNQHVPRLRHGPHHAAHRRDEHDDPRRAITRASSTGTACPTRTRIEDNYSLILANPPFKRQPGCGHRVSADLLKVCKTKKTELLFLALFLRMLNSRRALRLHRAGRRAVRLIHGAQGDPAGNGRRQPPGSGDLDALRRVQALRGRIHRAF